MGTFLCGYDSALVQLRHGGSAGKVKVKTNDAVLSLGLDFPTRLECLKNKLVIQDNN